MLTLERLEGEHERGMALYGGRFAAALCAGDRGDPDTYRGWRGVLQMAADYSHQDPEILTLADDVYAAGSVLDSCAALLVFAEGRQPAAVSRSVRGFLLGVLWFAKAGAHPA